ncbi:Annexin [Ascodesmis nigricans]|uniref:Annexin n=1 Tax=Ascodesmis nigricans TaxID=341454 RepID=A0A4S2MUU6_9PEZI|nr:Annexin [Ascodesmis nigricans]
MPSPAPVIPPPPTTTYGHSKTSSLTVPGALNLNLSGPGSAPLPMPSPALQPYHGTYQSISPMPSPIFNASPSPSFNASPSASITNLPAFSLGPPAYPPATIPLPEDFVSPDVVYAAPPSPSISGFAVHPASPPYASASPPYPLQSSPPSSPEHRPRRSTYNPTPDAKAILSELKSTFSRPSPRPLINILPTLSPSDLSLLRQEYKHLFRGVNLAKHIKSVFPTTTPFGKLAFSLALGPYESEAWFANSWYQKRETRNELLIEALMGKTNEEIGKIKAAFKDAKYESSLEKAVAAELPRDKFRYAVMVQLGCVRMEEEVEVSVDGVREDVARLGNILERRQSGGETEMIEIIVNRSNRWLQAVVEKYRLVYNRDLQKSIRDRSRNLGETLLHVLAGATNAPLRDAKLLDQAITAAIEDRREDLLISRATRVHWDVAHLKRVKNAFRRKYGVELGERIRAATRGGYQEMLVRMVREER